MELKEYRTLGINFANAEGMDSEVVSRISAIPDGHDWSDNPLQILAELAGVDQSKFDDYLTSNCVRQEVLAFVWGIGAAGKSKEYSDGIEVGESWASAKIAKGEYYKLIRLVSETDLLTPELMIECVPSLKDSINLNASDSYLRGIVHGVRWLTIQRPELR